MKAIDPMSRENMPTATLHSGLHNIKSTTEPNTKAPIHAHQATNSALPRLMSINIPGRLDDGERSSFVATVGSNNEGLRGAEKQTGEQGREPSLDLVMDQRQPSAFSAKVFEECAFLP